MIPSLNSKIYSAQVLMKESIDKLIAAALDAVNPATAIHSHVRPKW